MAKENFNIIITGVGGQGLITLISIINEAAFIEGNDVRSSELRGLSQRQGAVETQIRFGKKVYSPLIVNGQADLIMSLELLEGLRVAPRVGKQAKILINKYFLSFEGSPTEKEALEILEGYKKNLHLISASEICKKELQNEVVSSVYLLGYAIFKEMIPLKSESVLKAIEKVIPQKYLELNKRAFNLAND